LRNVKLTWSPLSGLSSLVISNYSGLLASVKVQTANINATIAAGEATDVTIGPILNTITGLINAVVSEVAAIPVGSLLRRQSTVDQLAGIVAELLVELSATLNQLIGLNLIPILQGSLGPLGAALNTV
jgi:hypothetical protein